MNNFKQIRSLLQLKNAGDFYFIQILKRRKDNAGLKTSEKLIKSYSVYSLEDYDRLESKIIDLCNENNARAYIRLNKRNSKSISLHMIKALADGILTGNQNLHRLYESIVGQYHSDENKTWLIDVDGDSKLAFEVIEYLHFLTSMDETRVLFKAMIPTLNGYHIICKPFDAREFRKKYQEITIHKDNPTLLFFNSQV